MATQIISQFDPSENSPADIAASLKDAADQAEWQDFIAGVSYISAFYRAHYAHYLDLGPTPETLAEEEIHAQLELVDHFINWANKAWQEIWKVFLAPDSDYKRSSERGKIAYLIQILKFTDKIQSQLTRIESTLPSLESWKEPEDYPSNLEPRNLAFALSYTGILLQSIYAELFHAMASVTQDKTN